MYFEANLNVLYNTKVKCGQEKYLKIFILILSRPKVHPKCCVSFLVNPKVDD